MKEKSEEKTHLPAPPETAPSLEESQIKHPKLPSGKAFALRDKLTRQFYVGFADGKAIKLLDPKTAHLFKRTYLSVSDTFDWKHGYELVAESELEKLKKSYQPETSASELRSEKKE